MGARPRKADSDTALQGILDLSLVSPAAREALIHHSCERLLRLTRKMFHGYPALRRWETTDDIFQNSMVRLHRALVQTEVQSIRHFFSLAAVQVRRELVDLSRKYFGPEGLGSNHHTDHRSPDEAGGSLHRHAAEPDNIEDWTAFHEQVDALPDEERAVVDLLFYDGLQQEEAATLLDISVRTLRSRWQRAKLRLGGELNDGQASPRTT